MESTEHGNKNKGNSTLGLTIKHWAENVMWFLKRLGKNSMRIVFGILTIIVAGFFIWCAGIVMIAVGNFLKDLLEVIGNFCMDHKWIMAIIFAIAGYTIVESVERYLIVREYRRRHPQTRRRRSDRHR